MTGNTIILAHGVLGFGGTSTDPIQYFNGIMQQFQKNGLNVIAPSVDPVGSIQKRGQMLGDAILSNVAPGTKAHIIAHSMGGLDSRHAITNVLGVKDRIATLVTIGTPHFGSPVADTIQGKADIALSFTPGFIAELLREHLQEHLPALQNLTTAFCQNFNQKTPDVGSTRYINIAGDASKDSDELLLFKAAAQIGGMTGINDGVVAESSALRGNPRQVEDWPVDHAGEVGWGLKPSLTGLMSVGRATPQHLARYDAILAMLD